MRFPRPVGYRVLLDGPRPAIVYMMLGYHLPSTLLAAAIADRVTALQAWVC